MTLYYLSNTLHKVDFNQSTDTPYNMREHWTRRTSRYTFVHDKKRDGQPPDIVSWCGMEAAVTPYDSNTSLPMGCFNALSHAALYAAIKTRNGVIVIYHDPWINIYMGYVGSAFAPLNGYKIPSMPTIQHYMTTDWYTDELVYYGDGHIHKADGNSFTAACKTVTDGVNCLTAVGNNIYVLRDRHIWGYDDRIEQPALLYEGGKFALNISTRMISDVVMEIGYIDDDQSTDSTANMVLFDARSPYAFAAQMTPVCIEEQHINIGIIL